MKFMRICLIAALTTVTLLGLGGVFPVPAHAQLPPGWVPGTFYQNISNSPSANPAKSLMPNRKPTDPPSVNSSPNLAAWSGWSIEGFRAQPPSSSNTSASGEYCTDASGGQVFVAAGTPTDNLTCPAADAGS